jgi:hypothetical protein
VTYWPRYEERDAWWPMADCVAGSGRDHNQVSVRRREDHSGAGQVRKIMAGRRKSENGEDAALSQRVCSVRGSRPRCNRNYSCNEMLCATAQLAPLYW